MSYDFQLRKTAGKLGFMSFRVGQRVTKLLKRQFNKLKRAAVDPDPYVEFEKSISKESITLLFDVPGKDAFSEAEAEEIGSFKMDLTAPVSVMRIYVRRRFRKRLNELMGENFSFMVAVDGGKEDILAEPYEITRFSKEFAPYKIDTNTMEGRYEVIIIKTPKYKGEFTPIPEFADEEDLKIEEVKPDKKDKKKDKKDKKDKKNKKK
jgi:hypothetical protein